MSEPAEMDLRMERVKALIDQIKQAIPSLEELANATDEIKTSVQQQLASYALSLRTTKLKPEELEAFFKRPYHLMPTPGRRDNWYLIIPRFVDLQVGWLEQQTESFNIFLINRYVEWLGDLPAEIKRQLGFQPSLKLELAGDTLLGPRQDLDKAWAKYRPFLRDHDEQQIRINPRRAFELLASLIKDGVLPYGPRPVPPADFADLGKVDFELRAYQREAWQVLQRYSHIGVFYPASTGKTFLAMWAMTHLRGPHLVVVPTRLLMEQWTERLQARTTLKPEDYVVTTYQTAVRRHSAKEWGLLVVDETHHLPANHFSKLALIKRRQTMGLTASPSREDGREEYIFALTGYPVGLGWQYFRELGVIRSPVCHVWILKNFTAKLSRIESLLADGRKTLIFADSIEIGKTVAARFKLPHVYGETKQRLATIQTAQASVVSRVGDEGVSLPDIERVVEVSWLYGSRRQELQRFTRLLHGQSAVTGEHHILMTLDEYLHDRKRLFSVMDKGFKLEIHREGVSETTISRRIEAPAPRSPRRNRTAEPSTTSAPAIAPVADSGAIAGLFALPGVKKMLAGLPRPQQRLAELLLKNDGQWFKRTALPLLLGYSNDHSMNNHVKFADLVRRGLIEQSKDGTEIVYRTNLRARM